MVQNMGLLEGGWGNSSEVLRRGRKMGGGARGALVSWHKLNIEYNTKKTP